MRGILEDSHLEFITKLLIIDSGQLLYISVALCIDVQI